MKNWHIKNWRFSDQILAILAIQLNFYVLAHGTHLGFFINIGVILSSLLFVLHPVYPGPYLRTERELMWLRLVACFCMVVGSMVRYQV